MSESLNIIIKGGMVVTSDGISRADVGISQEKIVAIGPDLDAGQAEKVIDAQGKYVLPGAIDVHTHPVYADDVGDMSVMAAHGGVTTMLHYAYAKPGEQLIPTLEGMHKEAGEKSLLDFGMHLGLFDVEHTIDQLPAVFEFGVTSFKVFMTYAKLKWMTDDYWMAAVMDAAAKLKGLVMVHAENGLATDYLEDKYLREGASPVKTFTAMRPDILEAEAVNRAICMSQVMGSALYVVHNSAAACLEPLALAQDKGWRVIGETCPQYLSLTDDTTAKFKAQAKMGPPLRTREDNEGLWEGLAMGILDTIGSDTASKPKNVDDDFFDAPYGTPQIETMLTIMYDEGVNGGWITLPRLVEVMSENPARTFGLYPQKGVLQEGSDADVVLFDPTCRHTIQAANLHSNTGFTLYEGREVVGKPVLTMQRGRVVMQDGNILGQAGQGRFLRTDTSHLYED